MPPVQIASNPDDSRPPIRYDFFGRPIPTNLAAHMAASDHPEAAFQKYIDCQRRTYEQRRQQKFSRLNQIINGQRRRNW